MRNNRLDLLIRRKKGQGLLFKYKEMFLNAGFKESELEYIDLESSDKIREIIKRRFSDVEREVELLSSDITFSGSKLLHSISDHINHLNQCYIFSDDVSYCGMYLVKRKLAIEYSLNIARDGYSHTCFFLDKELQFSFTINYYDQNHSDDSEMFDIQRKIMIIPGLG